MHVKAAKTNAVVQRPASKLNKIEGKECSVNSDILNKNNEIWTQIMVQIPVVD